MALGRRIDVSDISAIQELNPDVIMLATGGIPLRPESIPGINGENVYLAHDILAGRASLEGKNIVIIGGGMTGFETAEVLAQNGKNKVQIYDMLPGFGAGMPMAVFMDTMSTVTAIGISTVPSHMLLVIKLDRVLFKDLRESICCHRFYVVSLGNPPDNII